MLRSGHRSSSRASTQCAHPIHSWSRPLAAGRPGALRQRCGHCRCGCICSHLRHLPRHINLPFSARCLQNSTCPSTEDLYCWAGTATCLDSWVPPDTTYTVALQPNLLLAAFYSFIPLILTLRLMSAAAQALRRRHHAPAADIPPWLHIDGFMVAVMAVSLAVWVATAPSTVDWRTLRVDVAASASVSVTFALAVMLG